MRIDLIREVLKSLKEDMLIQKNMRLYFKQFDQKVH